MGRRHAVEVPRRRLGRTLGRGRSRRGRDPVVREPALRPRRAGAPARGPSAEDAVARLTGGRRGPRQRQLGVVDGRRRRAPPSPAPGATTGPADAPGPASPPRGTSSSPPPPSTRSPRRSRRRPAGRSPSGCSTASPPPRRRAETVAASSRLRCSWSSRTRATPGSPTPSSTSGSTTTPDPIEELRRLYGIHQALFGRTPREEWVEVDDVLTAELRERLAQLGYEEELPAAFARWSGSREPGRAGRRGRADRPGRPREP